VKFYVGVGEGGLPVWFVRPPEVAEKIRHGGGAQEFGGTEGQAADGAELLFELRCHAGVDGEMAGVVGARGELVDEEGFVGLDEEFDTQDADYVERLEDGASEFAGSTGDIFGDGGGGDGQVEDMVAVAILDDAPIGVGAIGATGGDDGDFFFEFDEGFEDGGSAADGGPGGFGLLGGSDADLPFAVVTEVGGFEDGRTVQVRDGAGEFGGSRDGAEGREREAGVSEKYLLADTVLGGVEDFAFRADRGVPGGGFGGGRWDVFEFEGNNADGGSEAAHGVEVVIGGDDFEVGDLAGGSVGVGGKSVDAVAHAPCGDGEHASELSAAEDADGGAG